jgi:Ca-activated chloride channel family protein
MSFANKELLWLLLVIPPALAAFFWRSGRQRERLLTQFVEPRLLAGLLAGISPARRKVRHALIIVAVTLLVLAAARPQWGYSREEVNVKGLDIIVAIDTSKSMLAEDIAPNRLARAKLAALDLLQLAKTDRLGLVAFAGGAFLQCPLTIDDTVFRQSLDTLDVNIIPQGGTALAEAITTALTAFKEGDNHQVLVIFSDGEDNDEGAVAASQDAAKAGMKIFTVGVGTPDGEILRMKDAKGRTDYIRDATGNAVKSRLNETLLREVASATEGGFYIPLRGARAINELYEKGLAVLPKSESQEKTLKQFHEQYHWPLGAAILLLFIEILLPQRKRENRKSPTAGRPNPAPQSAATTALLICLLSPVFASASTTEAFNDYQRGNFTNALESYRKEIARHPEDLRLQFNAGTAAYRATNFDAAIMHFDAALPARDIKLQQKAYYNLGNAHFRKGEQADDLDQLQSLWEKSIKHFEQAVALDKADADAVHNLAFAKQAVEQLKLMRELARRAKEEADAATRQRNYRRALEIMEQIMQSNIAAKPFEKFAGKLREIDSIVNPEQPNEKQNP